MPSIAHNIVLWAFRRGFVPNPMQIALEKGFVFRKPPDDKHVEKFDVSVSSFQEFPLYTYGKPADGDPILYFGHGGGYLAGMFKAYFDGIGALYRALGFPIIVPDYPMPVETDALTTRQWTLDHFKSVRAEFPKSPIIVGGDSAGANLTLALAQDLGSDAKHDIHALFMLFGWFDLTRAEANFPVNKEEVLLSPDGIFGAAERFRGVMSATDPRISPIFGKFEDLPKIYMISGDKDMLFADSQDLEAKLKELGHPYSHFTHKGYAHDIWLLPSPDGRRALKHIATTMQASLSD